MDIWKDLGAALPLNRTSPSTNTRTPCESGITLESAAANHRRTHNMGDIGIADEPDVACEPFVMYARARGN